MLKKTILIILCVFAFYSCKSQTEKINGLSFVSSRDTITIKNVIPVKKASANYVALMPFGFIKDLASPKVVFNRNKQWFGETKNGVMQYGTIFNNENIKLMVKPQIWVWHGAFTGDILMTSDEDWKVLEDSYEAFILSYAKTATALKADVFCIGTELENFVMKRPTYWKKLIQKIRKIYSGKLTYAANWDEFKRVPFWKDLDYIGIDAYFPLTDKQNPTVADFEAGWQPHKLQIIQKQQEFQKPILFTEFGYRSIDFTGKEPWNSDRITGNINLEAQKNGLQAIHNQFWKEDWFAGGFLWKWFHNHEKVGGTNNNRFTPQNKPAAKLIKQLYGN